MKKLNVIMSLPAILTMLCSVYAMDKQSTDKQSSSDKVKSFGPFLHPQDAKLILIRPRRSSREKTPDLVARRVRPALVVPTLPAGVESLISSSTYHDDPNHPDFKQVQKFLDLDPKNVNAYNAHRQTLLMFATKEKPHTLAELLRRNPDVNMVDEKFKGAALHYAVVHGTHSVVADLAELSSPEVLEAAREYAIRRCDKQLVEDNKKTIDKENYNVHAMEDFAQARIPADLTHYPFRSSYNYYTKYLLLARIANQRSVSTCTAN